MVQRKASPAPSLLYSAAPAVDWVRTLTQFIDESLGALCAAQWQRAPIALVQQVPTQRRFR